MYVGVYVCMYVFIYLFIYLFTYLSIYFMGMFGAGRRTWGVKELTFVADCER